MPKDRTIFNKGTYKTNTKNKRNSVNFQIKPQSMQQKVPMPIIVVNSFY